MKNKSNRILTEFLIFAAWCAGMIYVISQVKP